MGVSNSPDIFQQKTSDLFNGFLFIYAYIDDLLILTKGDRTDHVQNLVLTINRLDLKGVSLYTNQNGIFRFLGNM